MSSKINAFLDRNYYTIEPLANIFFQIERLPPPADLRVEVVWNAAVLASMPAVASGKISFSPAELPEGMTVIRCVLRRNNNVEIGASDLALIKRRPLPGCEWKIDCQSRCLLNNGAPFFPFGMIMTGVSPDETPVFAQLAENNFNSFLVWGETTPDGLLKYQESAAAHNLFVVSHPDCCAAPIEWDVYAKYSGELLDAVKRATAKPNFIDMKSVLKLPVPIAERNAIYGEFYDKNIERVMSGVENIKRAQNLIGYFILDEPMPARYFDQYKFGQDYYARLVRADGYHPVLVNYSSKIPEGDEYVNWCDILLTDPYWSPPPDDETSNRAAVRRMPDYVSKITRLTDLRAAERRQAAWQILAGPFWSGCHKKRPLNNQELCCQTYLALIHGASGVFYWAYRWVQRGNWAAFRRMGDEIRSFTPFLLGPPTDCRIAYRTAFLENTDAVPDFKEDIFDPLLDKYPPVQARICGNSAGEQLLLAANSRHYPVSCRFLIPGLRKVQRMLDGTEPICADAAFADQLEPYATRAYRLTADFSENQPIGLTIESVALRSEMAQREAWIPFGWRKDKKNMLPNPGFENAGAEDWPDYCCMWPNVRLLYAGALAGRNCLCIANTDGRTGDGKFYVFCAPQHGQPMMHTFSIYLKGGHKGLKVLIRCSGMAEQTVLLTTDWQRYAITGMMPDKVSVMNFFEVCLLEQGIIWADNAQLELGSVATEYEA